MRYFDTSVIIAYYCPEILSEKAENILRRSKRAAISELVEVEMCSALSRKVREKDITEDNARQVLQQYKEHKRNGGYGLLTLNACHFSIAAGWLAQFTVPLRTRDALHLSLAFSHRIEIITADTQMHAAAQKLSIKCRLLK